MERLHMNYLRDLIHRLRSGDSERRIARDLDVSRPTIHKYRLLAEQRGFLEPGTPLPADAVLLQALGPAPQPPHTASTVEPHRDTVQKLLDQGVEMAAIYARLRDDHQYTGTYSSVRRFVHVLCPSTAEAVVRVHTAPGEEAQVDFGSVGPLYDPVRGCARPAYVFVATLCFSRHQYAELVFDQKTPTWITLHRHAFEFWGGVPQRLVPDNLKAAVIRTCVDGPVLGEAYRRMAQHYGFVISPTRPATPEHKGKVENGVHYVQRNFIAGQEFVDIMVANQRLLRWVLEVAGSRRHGTTHQAPFQLFQEQEQAALLVLPAEPFSLLAVKPVKVHTDCHVVIDYSYYSVPYSYIGHTLEAYIGERLVQLFSGTELVASHERALQAGVWRTRSEHYPAAKAAYAEHTPPRCRQIARRIGPSTLQVVEQLLAERPLLRLRAVQGILGLEDTVGPIRLEAACRRALHYGSLSYRDIKGILDAALDREPLPEATPALPQHSFAFARPGHAFAGAAEAQP
jgi:transposase